MSRTLTSCERRYPAVEKEACAIIEPVRRWKHGLKGRHFSLVTDQQAVSYMFDQHHKGKIKNSKILSRRLELAQFSYDIRHRPGVDNVAADAFSRVCLATSNTGHSSKLHELHQSLGHPAMPGCITLFVNGINRFRARKRKVFVGTAKRARRLSRNSSSPLPDR